MIGRKYRRSSGLGAQTCARDDTGKTCFVWDSGGNLIDCYAFKNYLNPTCWSGLKPFDPTQVSDGSVPLPAAPPVVGAPADLTTAPASGAAAQATVDQLLIDQMNAAKTQNQQFFANLNTQVNPPAAAPDCTSWWTYMTNSNCPVDCSRFPTSLLNSACPGGIGSGLVMPLAIAAGVLLLVVVIRR